MFEDAYLEDVATEEVCRICELKKPITDFYQEDFKECKSCNMLYSAVRLTAKKGEEDLKKIREQHRIRYDRVNRLLNGYTPLEVVRAELGWDLTEIKEVSSGNN